MNRSVTFTEPTSATRPQIVATEIEQLEMLRAPSRRRQVLLEARGPRRRKATFAGPRDHAPSRRRPRAHQDLRRGPTTKTSK